MSKRKSRECSDGYWPSHTPFCHMIDYCVHGIDPGFFTPTWGDDHVAELCMLMHADIDDFLWRKSAPSEGLTVRKMIDQLSDRARGKNDLAAAEMLYAIATAAAFEVMALYLRKRKLFDKIAAHRRLLPSLVSIHPRTAKVMAQMAGDARLGKATIESGVVGSKAWFVSNAPANVYARAIICSVELNQGLSSVEDQQRQWEPFDREHGVRTRVLPFPNYIKGIDDIPYPISPKSVLQYWRKGKEIILEEMPHFHRSPEWKTYHQRSYKGGAKPGAIQHAIFKDILIALRTIAGANKSRRKPQPRRRT